ncbi:hypothetical protein U1Q18_009033 [Sarracenia purpurea var. burkii]
MILPLISFCILASSFPFFTTFAAAVDILSPNQTLSDDGETLVSAGGAFKFGFFSPWNSNNRFVGIWFSKVSIQTPIWVANKNNPLSDSSGVLTITSTGNILIAGNRTNPVWSSNSSSTAANNPVLQLLDSGNLVVTNIGVGNGGSENYLWQSFDYPCDTLVPGMKLGWNLKTNQEWYLTSWRNLQDPSGDYTYRLDPSGLPQLVLRQGSTIVYRSGPWDGVRFGYGPPLNQNTVFNPIFVYNSTFVYFAFEEVNDSIISRFVVNQTGLLEHLTWNQMSGEWIDIITLQGDICDTYDMCGPNGICNINANPYCHCPEGFVPKYTENWNRLDWSGGCVRKTEMNCSAPEGFRDFSGVKLPDDSHLLVSGAGTMNRAVDCQAECLKNCSCWAYAKTDVSGCVVWFGNLVDMREYSLAGQDLYIRMDASDLGSSKKNKRTAVIASVTVIAGVFVLGLICWCVIRRRTVQRREAWRLGTSSQEAWKLWNEGNPMDLADAFMGSPIPTTEVLRCIQVALLCVQQRPEDRPTVSTVLLMLDSGNQVLPPPKQPGFYSERFMNETDSSSTGKNPGTSNEVTVTALLGR